MLLLRFHYFSLSLSDSHFPQLRSIYDWQVTTLWGKCPQWVCQLGQLSLPSLRNRQNSSSPRNYMNYGGWRPLWRRIRLHVAA